VKTRRFTFLIGAILVAATALVGATRLGVGIQARRAGQSFSSTTPGLSTWSVSIPGVGHSIAGWWVDKGKGAPVVLLLHAVRANRFLLTSGLMAELHD
jgi:hypothetical protein